MIKRINESVDGKELFSKLNELIRMSEAYVKALRELKDDMSYAVTELGTYADAEELQRIWNSFYRVVDYQNRNGAGVLDKQIENMRRDFEERYEDFKYELGI